MLKSLVKAIGIIACLALPSAAYAVGMGGINVSSALGEPLKAEIELVAVSKAEKGRLTARLASPEVYKNIGMDYPSGLPRLKFEIESRVNGEPYLRLTTPKPVNEPFVSMLVELSWPTGKLLREYTFLLDPPGYKVKQPQAAKVEPVIPVIEAPAKQEPVSLLPVPQEGEATAAIVTSAPLKEEAPLEEEEAPSEEEKTSPEEEEAQPEEGEAPADAESPAANTPSPAKKPAKPATADKPAQTSAVPATFEVKRGDTLSQIALESKPYGVSLERMLLALYRANSSAFSGKNMNRLKTGKILRMPGQDELDKISQKEAVAEFRAHVANWNDYRQKLAAASGATIEQSVKQETSGKINTAIADTSNATKEPPKEVIKLSKGETLGDKAIVSGSTKALQEKIHALEEEAIAREKALKDSNERVVLLEKNIKEMQHLIQLKGQPPASAKPEAKGAPPKIEAKSGTPAPAATASQPLAVPASAPAPASAVKTAKPTPKPVPRAVPAAPPPSFLDSLLGDLQNLLGDLLDNPVLLGGGAAAILALGGLGIMVARRRNGGTSRKKKTIEIVEDAEDLVEADAIAETAAPAIEVATFSQGAAAALPTFTEIEDVDPISEAELFLNFGRDAQAEEILKDALANNPANNLVKLKLLSIYANRKDTNAFSAIARQIESSGDVEAWVQAAEMGRGIDPSNPMYGGSADTPAASPAQNLSNSQSLAGLDLDLGFGAPEVPAESPPVQTTAKKSLESTFSGLDFDLSGATHAQEGLNTEQQSSTSFDISGDLSSSVAQPEKTTLDDLVFDITAGNPEPEMVAEETTVADIPSSSDDSSLGFTLDFPTENQPAATTKEAGDFDLSSINLNLETTGGTPSMEAKDAHWQDVATKLDLARAYQEMGDHAGAQEILEEVLTEGDEQQRAAAEAIKQQLFA